MPISIEAGEAGREAITRFDFSEHALSSLDGAPGAIFRHALTQSGDHILLACSAAAKALLEASGATTAYAVTPLFSTMSKTEGGRLDALLKSAAADGSAWEFEWSWRGADRQTRWLRAFGQPLEIAASHVVWDAFIYDISGAKTREHQLGDAVTASRQGLLQIDPPSGALTPLSNLLELTGYTSSEIDSIETCFRQGIIWPEDQAQVADVLEKLNSGRVEQGEVEFRVKKRDGRSFWALGRAEVTHRNADGSAANVVGSIVDITERKHYEQQARLAESAFDSHFAVIITDARGYVTQINRAFTKLMQYAPEDIVGKDMRVLRSSRHADAFYEDMYKHIHRGERWVGDVWRRRKDGVDIPLWQTANVVRNTDGEITHMVGYMIDISELLAARAEAERLALYDPLTGLPNRRYLTDRLDAAVTACQRHGHMGAVLFLDLDQFKTINDSMGHIAGDELLIEVADRLRSLIRHDDVVSRFGGDEFVVLLCDCGTDTVAGEHLVRRAVARIENELRRPVEIGGHKLQISGTIGVAVFPDGSGEASDYLRFADTAMYRGKEAGRDRHQFYNPDMLHRAEQRMVLEQSLRVALDEQQFELFAQPIVNADTEITSAEVLLRWRHPNGELLSPDTFLQVAEDCALIEALGAWIFDEFVNIWKRWQVHADNIPLGSLSMNVSPRQLADERFVDALETWALANSELGNSITLELTERSFLQDVAHGEARVRRLRNAGFRISLDDFGSGYASLTCLRELPFDEIKIDRSFVSALTHDKTAEAIIKTIISLGHSLDVAVIAEGVETPTQRQFLLDLNCAWQQGFLHGEPQPWRQFMATLFT